MANSQVTQVTRLQRLLAGREFHAFLDELLVALEDAPSSQMQFLRALGGEGLYLLLQVEPIPALLGAYSQLILDDKIDVPSEVIEALYRKYPVDELLTVARAQERLPAPPQSKTRELYDRTTPTLQVKRVVQILDMGISSYSASDAIGIRRSVFRSEQVRKFLQALSLRFPGLHAFPNYPLDQFADFDKLRALLDNETIEYGLKCRVDALLVIPNEGDPVAAFLVDDAAKDSSSSHRQAVLLNRLFRALQIPLFRLSTDQSNSVGVDEWYALLTDQVAGKIDCGSRIKIRDSHATLVPV